ncbi:MAG: M1 family metallopeptidase [Acidobacteria bacterium]|nr:M1 family metallopeptidase [Acidobacteriota bacterium]
MQKPFSVFFFVMTLAVGCLAQTGKADQDLSPIASYKIDARLAFDERQRPTKLTGSEQLTWRNASPDTITELQFHLYLNAFKNRQSTFFKESGGNLRGIRFADGEWGSIDITSLKIANGADLTSQIKFIQPDQDTEDQNTDDRTVISVPLNKPLKPNETVVLDIQFAAQLPRVYARTGYWGNFALVAQWFPKIGVWEEKGERRRASAGWNCHQFHANTEFYADFGDYDVTLTVPAIYRGKLGATGAQQSEQANSDGTVSYRFTQNNVHDFAWTIDDDYVVVKRSFKPAEWIKAEDIKLMSERLKLRAEAFQFDNVDVTLLLQPEHAGQAERYLRAAFNSLKYCQLWYGRYPHQTLTIVDPPFNASGADGMEYPTFITAGTSWWASDDLNPETVVVHEFAHQYWQGMVASNEFEEAWLDEGFTTYTESKLLQTVYGNNRFIFRPANFPLWNVPVQLPHTASFRINTFHQPFDDPIQTWAWKYYDDDSYAMNSYSRTGLTLHTLAAWLGEETMDRVMYAYATRWRFRHPTAEDFYALVNEISGQDQSWFFKQFMQGTATLDYEIVGFKNYKPRQMLGRAVEGADPNAPKENTFTARCNGEAWYPHEFRVTLDDQSIVKVRPVVVNETRIEYALRHEKTNAQWNEIWPHNERWHRFRIPTEQSIVLVELDPERRVQLEANQVNNNYVQTVAIASTARWAGGLMFWLQSFLQMVASLA